MADSDRSRSPVPMRNRLDPRGQAPPQPPPFFPRWCGPMSAAVRHLQNMPRPQNRPSWSTTQSGPYMMGRMWTPPIPPTSWASQQFPPAPPSNPLPPTLPLPYPRQHQFNANPLNLVHLHSHVHRHNRVHLQRHQSLRHSHAPLALHNQVLDQSQTKTRPPEPMALISTRIDKKTAITTTTRRSTASLFPGLFVNQPSTKS